jgi:hypothetical protein
MFNIFGSETLVIGICYQRPVAVMLRIGSREVKLDPAAARCVGRMLLEAADMADAPGLKFELGVDGADDE